MTARKPSTTSIRIRNEAYAYLQQRAADDGVKVVDLVDQMVEAFKGHIDKPARIYDPDGLPEFDVDGNRVSRWIRES
tara:strand:+ start:775 stop:1005 length:231 start_codon:yes stop_codon:yes gene_type:complete